MLPFDTATESDRNVFSCPDECAVSKFLRREKKNHKRTEKHAPRPTTRRPQAGGMNGLTMLGGFCFSVSVGFFFPSSLSLILRCRLCVLGWWVGGHWLTMMIDQIRWGGSVLRLCVRLYCRYRVAVRPHGGNLSMSPVLYVAIVCTIIQPLTAGRYTASGRLNRILATEPLLCFCDYAAVLLLCFCDYAAVFLLFCCFVFTVLLSFDLILV